MSTTKLQRTRGADHVEQPPVPKARRTRGRPTDYDEGVIDEACALIRQGATDREVCDQLGIGVTTFWRWREQYPEFRKAVEQAKDAQDDRVEASMMRVAHEGNVTAQIFWLKNRRPEKWRDRKETELIVPDTAADEGEPDQRQLALQMLALLNGAVYDPDASPATGLVIEGHAREEIDDGEDRGYVEQDGQGGWVEPGAEGVGLPDPDFDQDGSFDLDPGEL